MKEAFRLLNKSIIRVETPDINLDQEEELEEEEEQEHLAGGNKVLSPKTSEFVHALVYR